MAGGLVAHTHMCLAGFGKLLKECGLVILGGDILNSINAPRNRHPSFAECFGQSGGSLCHERLMHWVRYPGPWRFPGVVHWLDWETSADLPSAPPALARHLWAVLPLGRESPAADSPWLWAAAWRTFPALPAALQWKHSLLGAVPWARECRAWLEHSGELGNGCFSLDAARLGKLHELSVADTQKAVQDALQVSKSFLVSSCYTRVLFCVNQPALYRHVVYPRASQMALDTFA